MKNIILKYFINYKNKILRTLPSLGFATIFLFLVLVNPISSNCQESKKNLNLNSIDEISSHIDQSYPYGTYDVDGTKRLDIVTFQDKLKSNPDISFKLYLESNSLGDESSKFMKFQQYYKNIKVDSHGYTLKVKNGNIITAVSMNVNMEMEVDLKKLLSTDQRNKIGNCHKCRSELIISHEYSDDYSPLLVVKNSYGSIKIFDANDGTLLRKSSSVSRSN